MEEKQRLSQTSVVNLVHIFENFRPCCSPVKEQIHPQSRLQLTDPSPIVSSMLPSVTSRRALRDIKKDAFVQPSQVHCSTESGEEQLQAPKVLSAKCLSSFRGKITVGNWRANQDPDSKPNFMPQSGSSRNQVISYQGTIDIAYRFSRCGLRNRDSPQTFFGWYVERLWYNQEYFGSRGQDIFDQNQITERVHICSGDAD